MLYYNHNKTSGAETLRNQGGNIMKRFRVGYDWVNITCYEDVTIVTIGDDYTNTIIEHLYTDYAAAEKCYNRVVESIEEN